MKLREEDRDGKEDGRRSGELDRDGPAFGMDGRGLACGFPDVIVPEIMAIDVPVDGLVREICPRAGSTLEI